MNIVTGIPSMSFAETVFDMNKAPGKHIKCPMWLCEHNRIGLTLPTNHKGSKCGGMVLPPCVGTEATEKASYSDTWKRKFTWYDANGDILTEMMLAIFTVFAKQVLHNESDIVESGSENRAYTNPGQVALKCRAKTNHLHFTKWSPRF